MQKPSAFSSGISKAELVDRLRRFIGIRGKPQLELLDQVVSVIALADLTDHAYSDDPSFWMGAAEQAAGAAQFGQIVVCGGGPRSTCDGCIVTAGVAMNFNIIRSQSTTPSTDDCWITSREGPPTKAQTFLSKGLLGGFPTVQIIGNGIASQVGSSCITPIYGRFGPPNASSGLRDTVHVTGQVANVALRVMAWGREFST